MIEVPSDEGRTNRILIQVDCDVAVVSGVGENNNEGAPKVDLQGNLAEQRHKNRTADGCFPGRPGDASATLFMALEQR